MYLYIADHASWKREKSMILEWKVPQRATRIQNSRSMVTERVEISKKDTPDFDCWVCCYHQLRAYLKFHRLFSLSRVSKHRCFINKSNSACTLNSSSIFFLDRFSRLNLSLKPCRTHRWSYFRTIESFQKLTFPCTFEYHEDLRNDWFWLRWTIISASFLYFLIECDHLASMPSRDVRYHLPLTMGAVDLWTMSNDHHSDIRLPTSSFMRRHSWYFTAERDGGACAVHLKTTGSGCYSGKDVRRHYKRSMRSRSERLSKSEPAARVAM